MPGHIWESAGRRFNSPAKLELPAAESLQLRISRRYLSGKDSAGHWYAIVNQNLQCQVHVSLSSTIEHLGKIRCIKFSPDSEYVATGGDRSAQVYHLKSGKKIATFEETIFRHEYIEASRDRNLILNRSLCFSSDGQCLVTGGDDKIIKIWNIQDNTVVKRLTDHTNSVCSVEVSPNGIYLVSGDEDGMIIVWDVNMGVSLHKLSGNDKRSVELLCFSPDSKLFVANYGVNIVLWNTEGEKVVDHAKFGHIVNFVSFLPGGELFVGPDYSVIGLFKLSDKDGLEKPRVGKLLKCEDVRLTEKLSWRSVSWSHDDIWAVSRGTRDFQFWNVRTGEPLFYLGIHCAEEHGNIFISQ